MKNYRHRSNIFATTEAPNTIIMNFSSFSIKDKEISPICGFKSHNSSLADLKSASTIHQYSLYGTKNDLHQLPTQRKLPLSPWLSPKGLDTEAVEFGFTEEDQGFSTKFKSAYARWRTLLLVAKFVHILKKRGVERIINEAQLRKSVAGLLKKKQSKNDIPWIMADEKDKKAIKAYQDQTMFYIALERGAIEDIKYIREYLTKDPRNYLNDPNIPDRRVNKPNKKGYSPLYIACKNGNMQLVKILLEFRANPYEMCLVSEQEQESILTVAARWGYVEIARYLIENVQGWTKDDLINAGNVSQNSEIKKMIKSKFSSKRKGFGKMFICG